MSIDWSKAPEGTTHCFGDEGGEGAWEKWTEDESVYEWREGGWEYYDDVDGVNVATRTRKPDDIFMEETFEVNAQGGMKGDNGKPRWSLLDFQTLSDVVDVLELGAKKYSAGNFKHVEPVRYVDAFLRHWYAYQSGEELDSESGKSHLHHMICCLMFLDYFRREGKEIEWHG